MSTSKRVLKNTAILYIKVGISAICAIISTRFVLKALGVDDFGIYNIVGSIIVMLTFLNQSMAVATQRFMSYADGTGKINQSKEVFNVSFIIHILIAIVIAIVLVLIGLVIFESVLTIPTNRIAAAKWVYYFMIVSACLSMTTVPYNAVLIAHENMKYYSIIGSASAIIRLLITIYLLFYTNDRLILYGFLIACVSLIEFIISRIYCHLKYEECEINYKKYYNKDLFKEMRNFAGWQLLFSSSSILSVQGVSILLNSFFGTIVNAAQGIGKQLSGQLMVISNTMLNAVNPVIVKYAGSGNDDHMNTTMLVGSKLSYLLIIIIAVPVLVEMPYLLNLWLKKVPLYAVDFCRFEIILQLIESMSVPLATSISAKGDIKGFQIFSSLTYAIQLPIIYLYLKLGYNPLSVYYVIIFSVLILIIVRVYFAYSKCNLKVNVFLKELFYPNIILTVAMFIIILPIGYLMDESIFRFICVTLLSTLMLLIGIRYFVLTPFEKQLVTNIFNTIKKHPSLSHLSIH